MSHDYTAPRRIFGFTDRLLGLFGFVTRDKSSLCLDRMAALDDPATRKALAQLPDHILRDIGVTGPAGNAPRVAGEALRRHLW